MKKFFMSCVAVLGMSVASMATASQIDFLQLDGVGLGGTANGEITKPFGNGQVKIDAGTKGTPNAGVLITLAGTQVKDPTWPAQYKNPIGSNSMYYNTGSGNIKVTDQWDFIGAAMPRGAAIGIADLERTASKVTITAYDSSNNVIANAFTGKYYEYSTTATNPAAPGGNWNAATGVLSGPASNAIYAGNFNGLWMLTATTTTPIWKVIIETDTVNSDGIGLGLIGVVPEPTSMAIFGLAAGAAGFRSLRRRKNS
jgi:hypothetical protein